MKRQVPGMVTDTQTALLGMSDYEATVSDVRRARYWLRRMIAGRVDDETLSDAALCIGELADNARKHGPALGVISVAVYLHHDTVRVEVTDDGGSGTEPHVTMNLVTTQGHGLQIVSNVATRWGNYKRHDQRHTVWCELVAGPTRLAGHGVPIAGGMGATRDGVGGNAVFWSLPATGSRRVQLTFGCAHMPQRALVQRMNPVPAATRQGKKVPVRLRKGTAVP